MKELEAIRDCIRHWREADINPRAAEEIEALLPALEAEFKRQTDGLISHWVEIVKDQGMNAAKQMDELRAEIAALNEPMADNLDEGPQLYARWRMKSFSEVFELEALLPALVQQIEAKAREIEILRNEIRLTRLLEAENAALREPMLCGHPKACWQATKPDSVDAVVGYQCVDCEREQLAVAAAIDKTEELFVKILRGELPAMAANNCDAVAQALDAHDAALVKEMAAITSAWLRALGHLEVNAIAPHVEGYLLRELGKREKRGGE